MSDSRRSLRLAVLISGGGSNLQAFLDAASTGELSGEVVAVISDRTGAYGLVRAQKAGIPNHVVDYAAILRGEREASLVASGPSVNMEDLDRKQRILRNPDPQKRLDRLKRLVDAEQELIGILDTYRPDIICLAGFMRLLTPHFLHRYNSRGQWRVLNVHPALLPAFPGEHGYEDTLAYGCKWGGITVHFVDEGEDSGPIIAQAVYPLWPGDGVEEIRQRGLQLEYAVYPQVINWMAAGYVEIRDHPEDRFRVRITDPAYPRIVEGWVMKSLQCPVVTFDRG